MRRCCWLVALSACGRLGFDDSSRTGDANNDAIVVADIALAPGEHVAYIKAHNTNAYDVFGWSLALSLDGSTLAVGAPLEDGSANVIDGPSDNGRDNCGAVYVFVRNGDVWSQQAYIKPAVNDVDDQFGYAVALSSDGNTLAVGAPTEDSASLQVTDNSVSNAGAAYVFNRTGTTWTQGAFLKAAAPNIDDWFGSALALSGNGTALAVGAFQDDGAGNTIANTGAVFTFDRNANTWPPGPTLRETNQDPSDEFGYSIALSLDGNTMAVGSPGDDSDGSAQTDNSVSEAGAVHIFTRSPTWIPQGYLKATAPISGDFVGKKVAIAASGDVVLAAAAGDDTFISNSGAAYVYTRTGTIWSSATQLKATTPADDAQFGSSVALSGDGAHCAIGTPMEDGPAVNTGVTYLYTGTTNEGAIVAPQPTEGDQFGSSVALSNDGRTRAFALDREDGSRFGINAPIDNDAEDSGAVLVTYFGQ